MEFLIRWAVATLGIAICAYLLPGVNIENIAAAFVAALVLALVNTIIKPVLVILTLPITIMTLGLFMLVINALMVLLASAIVPGFVVVNFWWALLFSLILTVIMWILNQITRETKDNHWSTRW